MVTGYADSRLVPSTRLRDDGGVPVLRWLIFGAAGIALVVLALMHSSSVGAASGYPPNTVVSTYVDIRYCDGLVSVVTDQYGNLIDVCTTTGQRVIPFFPDNGFAPGYATPNFVNGNFWFYNNGFNGFPYYLAANTICQPGNFSCAGLGGFPFFFGYTGTYSGKTTIVVPSKNITVVGPPVYVKEATPPAATTVTAAPPAAPVAEPVPAAAPPAAGMATALNAPVAAPDASGGGVKILGVQSVPVTGVQSDPSDRG